MSVEDLLQRMGIVRHEFRKDMLLFFLPWLATMVIELNLCGLRGAGLSGIWSKLGLLILQPQVALEVPVHQTVGLLLFAGGLSLMIVAQLTLWRNYSGFVLLHKDHQLITHGVYRYSRNPIYLGALIVFTGLPIYAASGYALLAMLFQIPLFLGRIQMEEKLLAENFGEAYEAYQKRTRRLIPFLY